MSTPSSSDPYVPQPAQQDLTLAQLEISAYGSASCLVLTILPRAVTRFPAPVCLSSSLQARCSVSKVQVVPEVSEAESSVTGQYLRSKRLAALKSLSDFHICIRFDYRSPGASSTKERCIPSLPLPMTAQPTELGK